MARARNIPVGELSGSIGGLTFSKNKAGGVIKAKSNPINRNTLKQSINRNRFSSTNSAWHTLSDDQKNKWNTAGQKDNLSGLNLFISRNNFLKNVRSNTYRGLNNNMLINNTGSALASEKRFTLLSSPYPSNILFDFNRGLQLAKSALLINQTIPNNWYLLQLNFISTNLQNVLGISDFSYGNLMQNSNGVNQSIAVYYRKLSAQRSDSKGILDFELLFSNSYYFRSPNLASPLTSLTRRLVNSQFLPFISSKVRVNDKVELQFRIFNEYGNYHVLNNQIFTF